MATVGRLAVVLTASATDFERTMGRAARAVKNTEKEFMRSARRMEDIGRKWTMGVTVPIVAGLTLVNKTVIDWEDAFAGVRKTVDATEEQFAELNKSLRKMSERIPMTHRELAGIAETAGQLGIRVENIEDFTETMAMLGTATNMASDEAAVALAQMDNIMQSGQRVFDRYGATVVHLGNNLATTESNIVDFGLRIAGAGKIAGLTEPQVLAIGSAFASVGVNAEAGGTAISKVLASITEAVATGNKNLQGFAAVAGMSATKFAAAWREDAGEVFTRFVEGLGRSGTQAFAVLRNLGLTDQRLIRGFLSVAGAGDLLRRAIAMGTQAWEENLALIKEANERYKTAASRLKMLRNRAYNAAISFGGAFSPLLEMALDKVENFTIGLQRLSEWFERLPRPIRVVTGNLLLLLAAIGPATMAMGMLNKTIAATLGIMTIMQAFAANVVFAFMSWRLGAATLGEALTYIAGGPIKLVVLGITAAIAAAVLLAANWDKVSKYAVVTWGAISAAVLYGASLVVRGIGLMLAAIGAIVPAVQGPARTVLALADSLKSSAGQTLASAKSAANAAKTAAQAAESQKAISDAGKSAANTQEELAENIEGVGKAAQSNIQSFDEVHQIQDSMASAVPSLENFAIPAIEIPEITAAGVPGGGIVAGLGEQVSKAVDTAASAWDRLKKSMEPVNKAVQWIKDNWPTIGPVIEGIAAIIMLLLLPAIIKSGVEIMIAAGKHVLAWAIKGAAALAQGAIIVGQLILVVAKWAWAGVQALISAGKIVAAWAMQGLAAAAQGAVMVGQFVLIIAKWAWAGVQALLHAGKMAAAWVIALGPVALITAGVIALAALIVANWDWIKEKTVEIWGKVSTWLAETWDNIKNKASDIWKGIANGVIGFINKIIDALNTMIQGLNRISFSIPDWVPVIGGKSWGFNLRTISKIPLLAAGTNYVPQDMFAFLHKGEAVVPKEFNPAAVPGKDTADDIAQAVYRAIIDAFRIAQASSQTNEQGDLVLKIDSTVLARLQLPALMNEAKRQGINLVLRGV